MPGAACSVTGRRHPPGLATITSNTRTSVTHEAGVIRERAGVCCRRGIACGLTGVGDVVRRRHEYGREIIGAWPH